MEKIPLEPANFTCLLQKIRQESSSVRKKFEIIYYSKGSFGADQVVAILNEYKTAPEKMKVIKTLGMRMCRMECSEAAIILRSIPITENDRLVALDTLKRYLVDHQTTAGMEHILAAFDYESDKVAALGILQTVSSYVADKLAAGGHQGYAALGGLYTQNWPLLEHIYGPIEEQMKRMPGQGAPAIAPQAQVGRVPSMYTSHPSYAYPSESMLQTTKRNCLGARDYPAHQETAGASDRMGAGEFPTGAPPLGHSCAAPAPTGFSADAMRE